MIIFTHCNVKQLEFSVCPLGNMNSSSLLLFVEISSQRWIISMFYKTVGFKTITCYSKWKKRTSWYPKPQLFPFLMNWKHGHGYYIFSKRYYTWLERRKFILFNKEKQKYRWLKFQWTIQEERKSILFQHDILKGVAFITLTALCFRIIWL